MSIDSHIVNETGMSPTFHLSCLAKSTLDVLGQQRGEALVVGTHPFLDSRCAKVGNEILDERHFPKAERMHIVDQPLQTLYRLRELIRRDFNRYSVVIAAFEAHHFEGSDFEEFFHLLGGLSHGTVVAADYTLANMDPESMRSRLDSQVERIAQESYGSYRAWFQAHAGFTTENFVHTVEKSADWTSGTSFEYSPSKAGIIVSETLSQAELNLITEASKI